MRSSGVRAGLLALIAAVAVALVTGRQARANVNNDFAYLYDDDGFLIGGSLDASGSFTNTFITVLRPQKLERSFDTYDTQSVSFSRRYHQVVIATGDSITTVLVGPLTGFPVPGNGPVVTTVPGALLLRSVDLVETPSASYVYAADYADEVNFQGQDNEIDPLESHLYAFQMRPDGALAPLSVPSYPLGGLHAVGIAHLGRLLVVSFAVEAPEGQRFELQPFRINSDGSLTRLGTPVPADVTFPTLRAAVMPAPTLYAVDCGGKGGVSAFRLDPVSGSLAELAKYPTFDVRPCSLAVQSGTVVVGGRNPDRALEIYRADGTGRLHPVRSEAGPLEYAGVLAFAADSRLITAGDSAGTNEGLLLIRSWGLNPALRQFTAAPLIAPGPGSVKSFAGVFQRTAGLTFGQVTNLGGLLDYSVGAASWFVRGMTVWKP